MKNPQTLAEKLYQQFPTMKLKSIKDYACCAFTLMWALGEEPDDAQAVLDVGRMIDKGAIDVDCTVYWDKAARFLTGKGLAVEFRDIKDLKEIKNTSFSIPKTIFISLIFTFSLRNIPRYCPQPAIY